MLVEHRGGARWRRLPKRHCGASIVCFCFLVVLCSIHGLNFLAKGQKMHPGYHSGRERRRSHPKDHLLALVWDPCHHGLHGGHGYFVLLTTLVMESVMGCPEIRA